MSGAYEEPRRGTLIGESDGLDRPVLIAAVDLATEKVLIVNGDGTMQVTGLEWVKVDWRYIPETRAWKDLESLRDPIPDPREVGDDDLGDDEEFPGDV